jgi:hypothetical protein
MSAIVAMSRQTAMIFLRSEQVAGNRDSADIFKNDSYSVARCFQML